MDVPLRVKHGVFVRVVVGAGPHEFRAERRFPAEAPTRQKHCLTVPSDYARMHEDPARRHLGYVKPQV